VAVTILSILFFLAVPTYQRLQRKAKSAAIANDLRVFATVFQTHAHEAGAWPPEAAPGDVPLGLTPEELKFDDWKRTTPMGGKFDWEYNQTHVGVKYQAAILITPTDDGNPVDGNFRRGIGDFPLFIIEK